MDDIYIQILKYAKDNPGFNLDNIKKAFPHDFDWIEREYLHGHLFQTNKSESPNRFYLSFEDRFRLLEHEELKDARNSSKNAMKVAIISILLTLFGLGYQFIAETNVNVVNTDPIVVELPVMMTPNQSLKSGTPKSGAP